MAKQRFISTRVITVEECECCGESHDFPVEVVFDRIVDAMGFTMPKTETHDFVVTCPKKLEQIVLSVPVSLDLVETVVRIQPGK